MLPEEKVKKRMITFLEFKHKNVKWIQSFKDPIANLMTSAYFSAVKQMENQDEEGEIIID